MKARCDAASIAPWGVDSWGTDPIVDTRTQGFAKNVVAIAPYQQPIECRGQRRPNMEFIAHARTDVPRLVAEVKRLRAENKQLRKDLQWEKNDRMAEEERDEDSRSPSPSGKDYLEI